MYPYEIRANFELDQKIFGSLTKTELLFLTVILDSGQRHASVARKWDGSFVWDMPASNELAVLSGIAKAYSDLAEGKEQ